MINFCSDSNKCLALFAGFSIVCAVEAQLFDFVTFCKPILQPLQLLVICRRFDIVRACRKAHQLVHVKMRKPSILEEPAAFVASFQIQQSWCLRSQNCRKMFNLAFVWTSRFVICVSHFVLSLRLHHDLSVKSAEVEHQHGLRKRSWCS